MTEAAPSQALSHSSSSWKHTPISSPLRPSTQAAPSSLGSNFYSPLKPSPQTIQRSHTSSNSKIQPPFQIARPAQQNQQQQQNVTASQSCQTRHTSVDTFRSPVAAVTVITQPPPSPAIPAPLHKDTSVGQITSYFQPVSNSKKLPCHDRITTMTVDLFVNAVVQERPPGKRAKFRQTNVTISLVEIYGRINAVIEAPSAKVPRLVMEIMDDSGGSAMEAFYFESPREAASRKNINFTDWYRFMGQVQFQDKRPVLHVFWFQEVTNLSELEFSKQMVKETLQWLPES